MLFCVLQSKVVGGKMGVSYLQCLKGAEDAELQKQTQKGSGVLKPDPLLCNELNNQKTKTLRDSCV